MKVGILTGGGDCPGLNAVIRGVVTRGLQFGYEFTGIRDGWKGLVESITVELTNKDVSNILPLGGTILGTSRTNPFKHEGDVEKVIANLKALSIDALVCIGGDDTLGVASKLFDRGIKTVGVPKTIDNDLSGTDTTFGFDTAVSIVSEALDRLHTTAESHHRAMVVEVMGRNAGWIAFHGGLAGSADVILIPERPFDMDEVCAHVDKESREKCGK
ncbi:MAG: ATP-dependent 6-phosphofructokinase, partial [Thermodesulfobacteriota bacterium]